MIFDMVLAQATVKRDPTDAVYYLKNEKITLGVLPDVGGRVVLLKLNKGNNVLKSDEALWNEPKAQRAKPIPKANFKAYNGQIVWVGPQSEWWLHQDVNKPRKTNKAIWPPDPYLEYGSYKVDKHLENYIKMSGPQSRVTGLTLVKEITLNEDNSVTFTVTARNIRTAPVYWDLWLNARMQGSDRFYVPVEQSGILRIEQDEEKNEKMESEILDGYFTFSNLPPVSKKKAKNAKAFLTPNAGYLAGFNKDACLVIEFEMYEPDLAHKEQAMVEIYKHVSRKGVNDLLELEYHTPYQKIMPNETLKTTQTWRLYEYEGKPTSQEEISFLKSVIKQ